METTGIPMYQPVASTPYQVMDAKPGYSQRYSSKGGAATGIIQLVCGILALILGIAAYVVEIKLYFLAVGMWSGVAFYFITGILGIISARRQTGVIVGYMVMSILSAVAAFCAASFQVGMIVWSATLCRAEVDNFRNDLDYIWDDNSDILVHDSVFPQDIREDHEYGYSPMEGRNCDLEIAINSMLLIVFVIEFVVAIVGSGFTCGGICCGSSTPVTTTHVTVVSNAPIVTQQGEWLGQQRYSNPPQYQVRNLEPQKM